MVLTTVWDVLMPKHAWRSRFQDLTLCVWARAWSAGRAALIAACLAALDTIPLRRGNR